MDEFLEYITSATFILSVAVVVLAVFLWIFIKKLIVRYAKKKDINTRKGKRSMLMHVAVNMLRYILMLLTIMLVLQINGVNISSLVTGLGIASAIVGLALQDILKDVIMGVHILSSHFFAVGDAVRYGEIEGIVESFTLTTTKIKRIDNLSIMSVSNRNISEITKMSEMVDIDVPLSYDENVKKVHTVLGEICDRIDKVDGVDKCVYKGTQRFDDSAVIYLVRMFCEPELKCEMRRRALREIQNGLAEADIKIPYNQLDVHHYMDDVKNKKD